LIGGAILVPIGAAFVVASELARRVRLALIVGVALIGDALHRHRQGLRGPAATSG
jgi:hypothetical protein